jgi:hypothetical protein
MCLKDYEFFCRLVVMTTVGGRFERVLMATAAALVGISLVLYLVPPFLSQRGQGLSWLWVVDAMLFLIPFALLIPTVIRPRSVVAAVFAALPVGFLLMLGLEADPMSLLRFAIHLAAIACLAALVLRLVRGIVDHRFAVLWVVPALLLGLVFGYLAAASIGFHIRSQFCNWPLIGPGLSSYLCSG